MRIYSEASEETLRARGLLKEWSDDGDLGKEQYERLERETVSDLRTTNIFLRVVLFFFTVLAVGAAVGLFFAIFKVWESETTAGLFLSIFAAASYAAAEAAVSKGRLYRHGIEEALAVCSVGFLCAGVGLLFFSGPHASRGMEFVVPAVGAAASLWVWYRFNLWYAFPAGMIFVVFLPDYWTHSQAPQRVFIAAVYAAGVLCVGAVRSRHRLDHLAVTYSLAEAFLWLGLYLSFNLMLAASRLQEFAFLYGGPSRFISGSAGAFYWTTWVLIWCLPPLILVRGVRQRDRLILAVGAVTAILTLATNKPYLGWVRHTWDPMLLGVALTGVAVWLRRWLGQGPDGVRHGFTAARLSGKDRRAMNVGSAVLGLVTPHSVTPDAQATRSDVQFGGGGSGGAGASGDY